ncbi:MAG: hypothetical protein K2J79_07690 [Ruminiclostridium sp.]|nr:hypothetical protein [Ruminiclostridium sp.]
MAQIPVTNGTTCPNCGKRLSDSNQNKYLYGSPIRFCKKCKGAYVDKCYHEIAVDGFPPSEMSAKTGLKSALVGLIMSVASGGIFITEIMYSSRYHTIFPILVIAGIGMIIVGVIDSIRVKTGSKAKSLEKHRQESIQRLRDPNYAIQLKELGYNVPEEFLPQGYGAPVQQDMPNIQNQQFYQQGPQPFQPNGVQWQPYQQGQQGQQNEVQDQAYQQDQQYPNDNLNQ